MYNKKVIYKYPPHFLPCPPFINLSATQTYRRNVRGKFPPENYDDCLPWLLPPYFFYGVNEGKRFERDKVGWEGCRGWDSTVKLDTYSIKMRLKIITKSKKKKEENFTT